MAAEARAELLARRDETGAWRGHLASSALATAVAVVALVLVERERPDEDSGDDLREIVRRGLDWLARNANADGGWGDTVRSRSNLPTTLLCWSALRAGEGNAEVIEGAEAWIRERSGDLEPASLKRTIEDLYGEDKTFSVPILTLAALAGVLGPEPEAWRGPPSLPFELAALPQSTFRFLGLPVVSYALPALIAVGQVQHHRRPSRFRPARLLREAMRAPTLRRLEAIQPSSGGFLEAIPLTGFVTLSLVGAGEVDHPVVARALDFLRGSQRDDGAWPIDIDLATWVTTLSIQGLASQGSPSLDDDEKARLRAWLLGQQYREVHPFTGAAPGGWAWTDLPGGVPDADDTPGALLALRRLGPIDAEARRAAARGLVWLADLQNRDGGLPTFCRGWGKLPFDRSSPDLTAHALRAVDAWRDDLAADPETAPIGRRLAKMRRRALAYLRGAQQDDGSWIPLWFGHEAAADLGNRVYGTARVLRALAVDDSPGEELALADREARDAGVRYLLEAQDESGGWGGARGLEPSVEETALALEALRSLPEILGLENGLDERIEKAIEKSITQGLAWLCRAWDAGEWREATPIGFYFANLWYFEDLYPLAFTVAALGRR